MPESGTGRRPGPESDSDDDPLSEPEPASGPARRAESESGPGAGSAPGSDPAMVLGVTLRRMRRERGVPQRALLASLNLASHTAIVDFESGRRIPAPDILAAYERVFGLEPGGLGRLRDAALAARASHEASAALAGAGAGPAPGPRSRPPAPPRTESMPPPRLLPPPPRVFSGRAREIAALSRILGADADRRSGVPLAVVTGTGGIGKTSLAVRWAQDNSGLFPDGQLYIDLRGFDPVDAPLDTAAALRAFLSALGTPHQEIPPDTHSMTAQYRSLIAGRRMLVFLDNAYDSAQVTPLLPGDMACTALVTSRHRLGALVTAYGAVPVHVDALDAGAAREVLVGFLGRRRAEAEPEAVRNLLEACSGMPLALTILAARAATRPDFPLAGLTGEVGAATGRLDLLDAGELTADVRAVFACSYRAMPADIAEAFGLLGLAPGPDIGLAAAAALLGLRPGRARLVLQDLEDAHLVHQHAPDRYRMHDLVRLYAAERGLETISAPVCDASLIRLADHYLAHAAAGERRLHPHGENAGFHLAGNADFPGAGGMADTARTLAWFEAEHANLLAVHRLAAERGWHATTLHLAWAMDTFHARRGRRADNLAVWRAALVAAEQRGVAGELALAHRRLGRAFSVLDDHDAAAGHLARSLALACQDGDPANQAYAYVHMAWSEERRGDDEHALRHASEALALFQTLGDTSWVALARNAVGWYAAKLGRYEEAQTHCHQALALHSRIGNRGGEAATLDSLGFIYHAEGDHTRSAAYYRRTVALYREFGDQYSEADTLLRLGEALAGAGASAEAAATFGLALELYRRQHRDQAAGHAEQRLADLRRGSDDAVVAKLTGIR